jgi:L-ascorbate metabolism protein UlaG (beta-lactamase superfamily)
VSKRARTLAALALLLVAAALLGLWLQTQRRPDLAPYQDLTLPSSLPSSLPSGLATAAAETGALRLRFAGVSTLVFDDGETVWMTDGFFSRPGLAAMLASRIAPQPARIADELKALELTRLAAVIPLHSHYDHAMDAPEVARQTDALLIGSASTLQIGRGAGLAEDRMREVRDGQRLQLGRFTLTFFASRHSPTPWSDGHSQEEISAPLRPPAHASAWREGQVWALLVEHDGRRLWLQASAGFVPGALRDQRADVVLLGIGTLGKKDLSYIDDYWREVVQALGARRVIPIHWDDFWQPLDEQPLRAMPYLFDDVGRSLDELQRRATAEQRELRLPPLRSRFNPWP